MVSIKKYFNNNLFILLLLFLVGFLVYGNVVGGKFLFDDNILVENNVLIRSLSNFGQFFTSNSETGAGIQGSNFYRPIQYIIYAVIYHFFGLNSIPFHIISITLHIINAFLIFLILQKLNFSRLASFISGVTFIIHPVNIESISYISGIADPLGFFFLFLGFLSFLNIKKQNLFEFLKIFLFFILALLSKESTVIFFPILIILLSYSWGNYSKEQKKLSVQIIIGSFFLFLVYLILKFKIFNFTGNIGLTGESNIYTQNIIVRIITFISILWEYVKLIFLPINLFLEKPYIAYTDLLSFRALFGFAFVVGGFFLSYKSFFGKKIFFLGFVWFMVSLAPLSGIIPLNAMFLEHWLYFPIFGVLILLAGMIDYIKGKGSENIFICILLIFSTFFSIRTIIRNFEWADPIKFYTNELKYSPESARIHNNLAMEYSNIKKYSQAEDQYKKSILINDTYPQTHNNLANLYFEQKKFKDSETEYFKAIEMSPNFMYSYSGLLKLYEKTNVNKQKRILDFIKKINNNEKISEDDFNLFLNLQNEK